MVRAAKVILQVACLEPFSEDVMVKGSDASADAPPFRKVGLVFRVTGILKNADNINVPGTIHVPVEGWQRSLSEHKARYAGGPSKSHTVKRYKTAVDAMSKADVVFLRHFQGQFELEVRDAFESMSALEKIKTLIAAS